MVLDLITFLAHPFVRVKLYPREDSLFRWGVTGQHRGIVIVFCQRSLLLLLLDACQRVIVVRKWKVLQRKFSEEILSLSRRLVVP